MDSAFFVVVAHGGGAGVHGVADGELSVGGKLVVERVIYFPRTVQAQRHQPVLSLNSLQIPPVLELISYRRPIPLSIIISPFAILARLLENDHIRVPHAVLA